MTTTRNDQKHSRTRSEKQFCPWCYSRDIEAEFVDMGYGPMQVSGYQCFNCHAYQFSLAAEHDDSTPEEKRLGFFMGMPEIWRTARQRHSNYMLFMRRMFKEIELLLRLQDLDAEITDDEAMRVCQLVGIDELAIERSLKAIMKRLDSGE